jgi:hypothetical protein
MVESVAVGLFALWLLLSAAVLFPKLSPIIRRADWLCLVPEWKFFAPNPGRHDFHLLYRDQFRDGTLTEWTEVSPTGKRRWWHFLWNPAKRGNKALFDTVSQLFDHVRAGDKTLEVSIPYLTLLNYVSSLPRTTSPVFTQFLLMCSQGNLPDKDPELCYFSARHSL